MLPTVALANCAKKDSTGVCFIGERHFKPFLQQVVHSPAICARWRQRSSAGTTVGPITPLVSGVGWASAARERRSWFVLAKDMEHNKLIVTQGADHPLLYSKNALGTDATWIAGEAPAAEFDCTCKYRYRQPDQAVHVSVRENGQVLVTAEERQRAVTPGQSMVFLSLGEDVWAAQSAIRCWTQDRWAEMNGFQKFWDI
ncbi:MAG: aminomethyltransferase beta-barrel domain-containing protein [Christensenellales bacterium]